MQGILLRPEKTVPPRNKSGYEYSPTLKTGTSVGGEGVFVSVNASGEKPVKYTDPDGNSPTLVAAGIGALLVGSTNAAIAFAAGKSGREIGAAFAGGAVAGGMAGLTMGASLAVGLVGAGLAGTAGYMAENIVNGESHTVMGTIESAGQGVTDKMGGAILEKGGSIVKTAINKLPIEISDTANKIINTTIEVTQQVLDTAKDAYRSMNNPNDNDK